MAGIYIHVPFCHGKCSYCDFYSGCRPESEYDAYVESLLEELHERVGEIPSDATTIYIGGGTPSILSARKLIPVIEAVKSLLDSTTEVTIEVNPEDVTVSEIEAYSQVGVNRISMGIQSFNDKELKYIGRRHTSAQALHAVETIRKAGIENISCDLIYGLPCQTLDSWKESLDRLLNLGLPHFSAYLLSYEPGTKLYASMISGKITPMEEGIIEEMYVYLCHRAQKEGYEHYEISNFARPGRKSIHNSSYWKDEPYLGLGPSAVSFDGRNIRRTNKSDLKQYLKGKREFTEEIETTEERINDAIFVRLRTSDGLDLSSLPFNISSKIRNDANAMLDSGMLFINEDKLAIPEKYLLVSDMIIRDLML